MLHVRYMSHGQKQMISRAITYLRMFISSSKAGFKCCTYLYFPFLPFSRLYEISLLTAISDMNTGVILPISQEIVSISSIG